MKKARRILSLVLALLMMAMLCSACGNSKSAAEPPAEGSVEQPVEDAAVEKDILDGETVVLESESGFERKTDEGTLVVGTTGTVYGYNNAFNSNTLGNMLVYETLFARDPETLEFYGVLADTWEWLDDTTLRIVLKDNVYFSNGEKLEADDIIYSLHRHIDEEGQYVSYVTCFDWDGTVAEDERTVILKLVEPYGPLMANLCDVTLSINNREAGESMDEADYWDKPVGTGPYTVVENVDGSHSTYALRDDYWNPGAGYDIDTITVRVYADAATMFIDFENGALDVCVNPSSTDVDRLIAGNVEDCTYIITPMPDTYLLTFASYCEPLQDINVRKAIAHGVDWDAVAEAALGNLAITGVQSSLSSSIDYYVPVGSYEYDPELAAQYLSEAAYTGDITLTMVIPNRGANPIIAESVQAYLAELGITLNIEEYDLSTAISKFMAGEVDVEIKALSAGVTTLDPHRMYDTMSDTSTNLGVRIDDEQFQEYLHAGAYNVDPETRAEAYANVQQWLFDNYQGLPICEVGGCLVYRNYIESVPFLCSARPLLAEVTFVD